MLKNKQLEELRLKYPKNTRIRLDCMYNDPRPVEPDTKGTVEVIDDMGTIHCRFDNGRRLGISPEVDEFHKILKISIDFDDVLYYTCKMIFELGEKYLKNHNIDYKIDETQFDVDKLFDIPPAIASDLWINAFEMHNPAYLIDTASMILRTIKDRYDTEFEITTSRPDFNNERIKLKRLITAMEPEFEFDNINIGIDNKAAFLAENCFDIHIDDHPRHISALQNTNVVPILTDFESTRYNKAFTASYDGYVMKRWADLPRIIETIISERKKQIYAIIFNF